MRLTVVLATGANAFLRVDGALELGEVGGRIDGTEEDGLVLVHSFKAIGGQLDCFILRRPTSQRKGTVSSPSVGEEQSGVIVGDGRGRGDKGVLLLLEEVQVGLAHFLSGPRPPLARNRVGRHGARRRAADGL